ncbi:zinc finger protein 711 isoform 3-T3 [Cochliomyia hominivorax]
MFSNYCICCFSTTGVLLSLTSKSTHMDGKTLWNYLNSILGFCDLEYEENALICLRCSKALQVSYHFIQMIRESKAKEMLRRNVENYIKSSEENTTTFVGISIGNQILHVESEKEICSRVGDNETLNSEHQLEIQNDQSVVIPANVSNDIQNLIQETNKEVATLGAGTPSVTHDFCCTMCNEVFEDKNSFYEHNKLKHKQIVPFKCKLCSYYTCYRESLIKHYKVQHKLNNMELDLYEAKSVSFQITKTPVFVTYLCLHCNFESCAENLIDDHLLIEHFVEEDKDMYIKKLYKCPSCQRSFKDLKCVRIHYTRYHCYGSKCKSNNSSVNKKHACEKCGKSFDLKSSLFLHKRICEKRNAVNCNFCELLFSSVLKYEQHLENKHAVSIRHECEICGKTFRCAEYLAVHRKRHNERHYQCDLCNKNYINNAELKVHKQRIHNKMHLPFVCNICGKIFLNRSLLREHENEQHSKRYFKCLQCDYISNSSFAVKVHKYKHMGKPYKCPICSKDFIFRKDIKQHAARHHSTCITQEEMAQMFRRSHGYTSRYDAFSQQNNNLEITEIKELELEGELKEFGLTLQDIMQDLFNNDDGDEK